MNCAYHVRNPATANCNSCGKGLCRGCDHRIKGYPFCENCILAGVESLRTESRGQSKKRVPVPVLSFIFSILCPGLGAAYNGETVKAFVHFGLVAGLFQLAVQTGGMPIPVLGFLGLWFFILPMDAMLTAKVIKSGISQSEEEEILNGRFGGGRRFLGFILLAVGIIFLLTLILGPALISKGILPILLVILGIYATRDFMKTSRRLLSGTSRVPTERQQGSNAFRSGSWK
jgi:hypothetical protein